MIYLYLGGLLYVTVSLKPIESHTNTKMVPCAEESDAKGSLSNYSLRELRCVVWNHCRNITTALHPVRKCSVL